MVRLRINYRAALLAAAASFCAGSAYAETEICMRLEARLTALDNRPRGGDIERRRAHDRSIRQQRDELDRATTEARQAKCMGAFFPRLNAKAACGQRIASINRIRANLKRLTAARDRLDKDPFSGGRERGELVRALADNRCGAHYDERAPRRRGIFSTLFGGHRFRERGWGGSYYDNDHGTYRTLCVRTCDGYYFPISFSTSRTRFAHDEQLCRSMCPGTDVALYIHRNPGQESDAMISLAGEPYTVLPAAFRYRREYDPACKCGQVAVSPDQSTTAGTFGYVPSRVDDPWGFARDSEIVELPSLLALIPIARPSAGEDPETLANRAGDFVPERVNPPKATIARLKTRDERSVRIVGPSYLYAQ